MQYWLLFVMAISCVSRASAFLAFHNRRISCRASVFIWDRQACFTTTISQVKHTDDDNREIWQPLTRTQIRRLKLAAMREELAKRGMDTTGTRPVLMERLLETVDNIVTRGRKKDRNETSLNEGCPPLDPHKTYVLRVKGCGNLSYNSSGFGLVLYDADTVREVWVARKYFSQNITPFEADYRASILGLQVCLKQGAQKIVLQSDNDVMIKQIRGDYNVNKPKLKELNTVLQGVLSEIAEFNMTHISSAENTRAKNLAQRAMGTKKTVGLPEDEDTDDLLPQQQAKAVGPVPELVFDDEDDEDLFDDEPATIISPEETYLLQFDGGARGNPGIAGSGMVLYDPHDMKELWCGWKYLGDNATNNAAEYNGLLLGIQCARSLGVRRLRAEGDSNLIVRHMNGSYKVREPNLKKLLTACKDAIQHLDYFEIRHIPRKLNARADQLANQAMDTRGSFGFDELD